MADAFLSPALVTLRDEVDAQSPDRDRSADGWIGDPAHASRHSDHNPEPDGSVDAIDITHDPAHGVDCNLLADQVKDDPRIAGGGYVIWNRRIWNPSISRSWRPYTGSNGHTHHMHVSVSDRGQNDTSPWLEKEGLTMADVKALEKKLDRLIEVTINQNTRKIKADLNRERREAERRGEDTREIVAAISALDDDENN